MMSNEEKFEGFIQKMIDDNERQYGEEIRGKYGDGVVDGSNAKVKNITKEQYARAERLSNEVNEALRIAFEQGDPTSELAQKACELHKEWLCCFLDHYSKKAHIGVTQMYVDDPRFAAYYDKIAVGCAAFLRDAVLIYCK
ncbi:MAG: TipAS antibiotic-recognition domain-containing protein [Clostridia bacterium]|nr:TipAS antibiotic-recognition domain-containing protein [Clostridia bacterium]